MKSNPLLSFPSLLNTWQHLWINIQWAATLLVFFTGSWWWRPTWLGDSGLPYDQRLYFIHFGFAAFAAVALVAWLFTGLRGLLHLTTSGGIVWAVLLIQLAVWGRISYGADVRNAEVALSTAAQWLVVAAFAVSVAGSPPPLRAVVITLAGAAILQSMIGIGQTALQRDLHLETWIGAFGLDIRELPLDPLRSGVSVVQADGVRYLRPYGLTAHPNLLAGMLVMGLCALLSGWMRRESRSLTAAGMVICWWGLLLTFSRAAVAGFVVGTAFFVGLWILRQVRDSLPQFKESLRGLLALGMLLSVVAVVFMGIYAPLVGVRSGVARSDQPTLETLSAASRAVYIEQAKQLIRDHPWKGVGMGNMAWESAWMLVNDWRDLRGDNVHNIYLLGLSEVGIIGFMLFSGAVLTALVLSLRRDITPVQMGLMAGVVAWLAIGWYEHYTWTQMGDQMIFWGVMAVALSPASNKL